MLLLSLARVPLWLTMPIDSEAHAIDWVFATEAVVLFTLGAGRDVRGFAIRFLALAILLMAAWAVTDAPALKLAEWAGGLAAVSVAIVVFERLFPAGLLGFKAALVAAVGYRMLA